MEVKAIAKNVRVSPSKLRPLMNAIRGMRVDEALDLLRFTPTPRAKYIAKVVKSAAANAENNFQTSSSLKIVAIFANEAPRMKRFIPRARGRVGPIIKRSSHITVVVAEEEAKVGA